MTGNGNSTKPEGPLPIEDNSMSMSADEVNFLIDCLKYPVGGGFVSIDAKAVAEARGQKNAGSVANRITKMKKKYNLPISSGITGPRKLSDSSPAAEAKVPITPNKNKVVKTRGTRGVAIKVPKASKFMEKTKSSSDDSDGEAKGFIYEGQESSKKKNAEVDDDVAKDGQNGEGGEDKEHLEVAQTLKFDEEHGDEV